MRVGYYELRQWVEGAGGNKPAGLVELVPAPLSPTRGYLVEFEEPRGATMRAHLPGGDGPALEADPPESPARQRLGDAEGGVRGDLDEAAPEVAGRMPQRPHAASSPSRASVAGSFSRMASRIRSRTSGSGTCLLMASMSTSMRARFSA